MRFIAIDVETANPAMSSICQVGAVVFEDGMEVESRSYLINPQDYFYSYNVDVHGITAEDVRDSPTFAEVIDDLRKFTDQQLLVSHTHFDRVALSQTCEERTLDPLSCRWLDSAKVARRTWPQFAQAGYGLANLAKHFCIEFQHHDALHDARAAGLILLKAVEESGSTPDEWVGLASTRFHSGSSGQSVRREGGDEGPLVGERIVFTGGFDGSKREAADIASSAGAAVEPGVTKKTTLLVVGGSGGNFAGKNKSAKHRKAEGRLDAGQAIRIISEKDFLIACQS